MCGHTSKNAEVLSDEGIKFELRSSERIESIMNYLNTGEVGALNCTINWRKI